MVYRFGILCVIAWLSLAVAAQSAPITVVVISDLNGSYGSTRYHSSVTSAIKRIIALEPDLVISTGDMVAGQRRPHLEETELRAMWEAFHRSVSEPLRRAGIALAVTPGNHDASAYPGFELERRIYAEEWGQRRPNLDFVEGGNYPFYYAFDIGPARFMSLDVTTVGSPSPAQKNWLRNATADGSANIVFSHLPLWPFAVGRETEIIGDPNLERLFVDHGVDLHLSGHHHAFYPGAVKNLALVSQACLGSGQRALIGETKKSQHVLTFVEIDENGGISVSALEGPEFDTPLQINKLPLALQSSGRIIERLDIAPVSGVRWKQFQQFFPSK